MRFELVVYVCVVVGVVLVLCVDLRVCMNSKGYFVCGFACVYESSEIEHGRRRMSQQSM